MDIGELISKLKSRNVALYGKALVLVGLFGVIGVLALRSSGAATYATQSQAEDGIVNLPAEEVSDPAASGGSAVRFQAASTPPPTSPPPSGNNYSLRFFGTQTNDIDRVKIPLTTNKSIDVGGNFTLEWWMKTAAGNDLTQSCAGGANVNWINGNIIWDRDINGPGDAGDYGISVFGDGRLAFGVESGSGVLTFCSTASVNDGQWHHVAATRNNSSGQMCLYIDGTQRGCGNGPAGDIAYRDGRSSGQPNSDPYLVLGAEKHDFWTSDQGYHGWIDEARMSSSVRYTANFSRPNSAFTVDGNTVALYHFNTGNGTVATDETGANNGQIRVGGSSNGPQWTTDVAF